VDAEFHEPDWVLGQSTMVPAGGGLLGCCWRGGDRDRVGYLDTASGELFEADQPCVSVTGLQVLDKRRSVLAVLGSTSFEGPALYGVEKSGCRLAYRPRRPRISAKKVSTSVSMDFPASTGFSGHLLLTMPAEETSPPPLVVSCHGGPTGRAIRGFDPVTQLFTSRGFAVAAVDYRGSSGFGREYRRALEGKWGIYDADDVLAAAGFLVEAGLVDGSKMVVRGASAGGFTALRALARGRAFLGASVMYGVTDLRALARDTHKFESRYLERLVGPWPGARRRYTERSPACHPERIRGDVLLLQGSEDPVVPPAQAELLARVLRSRGARCEMVVFPGEGHGFRSASAITDAAALEIAFVERLFARRQRVAGSSLHAGRRPTWMTRDL
jgi:dipeptidyl aminopeptidase/acylaminoacyl peptidase